MKFQKNTFFSVFFLPLFISGIVHAAVVPTLSAVFSAHTITVSWAMPQDAAQYEVRYSTQQFNNASFANATLGVQGGSNGQNAIITNLTSNTLYYIGLKITNVLGVDSFSFISGTTLQDNFPPGSVTQFSGSASQNSVTLSWIAPNDNDMAQYEGKYSTALIDAQNFSVAQDIHNLPTPFVGQNQSVAVGGLNSDTQYYFALRVIDTVGQSSSLAVISVTTQSGGGGGGGNPNLPMPVNNFTASSSPYSVHLSWFTPNDASLAEFMIRYSTILLTPQNFSQGMQILSPFPIPNTTQFASLASLLPNTIYYFGITTKNVLGNESSLEVASTTTLSSIPPVINFVASPLSQNEILLSWDTPTSTALSQFDIRMSSSALTTSNFANAAQIQNIPLPISGRAQNVRVAGLSQGTTYYFGIQTISTIGEKSSLVTTNTSTNIPPPQNNYGGGSWGPGAGYITYNSTSSATSTATSTHPQSSSTSPSISLREIVINLPSVSYPSIAIEEGSAPLVGKFSFVLGTTTLEKNTTTSLDIFVDVGSAKAYGARIALRYPSELLKIRTITYEEGMVPLLFGDREEGVIVREIESRKEWMGSRLLMTIIFEGVHTGEGKIQLDEGGIRGESHMRGKVWLADPLDIKVISVYLSKIIVPFLGNLLEGVYGLAQLPLVWGIGMGVVITWGMFGLRRFIVKDE